tara:strand:+ start:1948 stop:3201 length:1254 start_codon:yes stop_codon:yes gene_type:complete
MDLDFNIQNYSYEELLKLFNNAGRESDINLMLPYIERDIVTSKNNLITNLILPTNSKEKNDEINSFLNSASQILINKISINDNNLDLIAPKNFDNENFINHLGGTSNQNHIIPDIMNPIKFRSFNKMINIDTKFRSNYYNSNASDFQFTLPMNLTKVVSMNLDSFQIPLTYYAISKNKNNNKFIIKNVLGASNGTNFVITIPDGNYITEFDNVGYATTIESAVNNAMKSAGILSTELIYNVDKNTGKSIISSPIGSPVKGFKVSFNILNDDTGDKSNSLPLHLGWLLGFRTGHYTAGGSPGAIVSEGICLVRGPTYIYLCVDDFTNNSNHSFINAFNSSMLNKDILTKINTNNLEQTDGIYQYGNDINASITTKRNYFGPVTINKFRIGLYDEYGRIVDLNNMDWSLTLVFECLYNE